MPNVKFSSDITLFMDDTTYEMFENIRITSAMLDLQFAPMGDSKETWMRQHAIKLKMGSFRWELVQEYQTALANANGTALDFTIDFLYDQLHHIYDIIVWEHTGNWNWLPHQGMEKLQYIIDKIASNSTSNIT